VGDGDLDYKLSKTGIKLGKDFDRIQPLLEGNLRLSDDRSCLVVTRAVTARAFDTVTPTNQLEQVRCDRFRPTGVEWNHVPRASLTRCPLPVLARDFTTHLDPTLRHKSGRRKANIAIGNNPPFNKKAPKSNCSRTTAVSAPNLPASSRLWPLHPSVVNLAYVVANERVTSTAQSVLTGIGLGFGGAVGEVVVGELTDLLGIQQMYLYAAVIGFIGATIGLNVRQVPPADRDDKISTLNDHGEKCITRSPWMAYRCRKHATETGAVRLSLSLQFRRRCPPGDPRLQPHSCWDKVPRST